MQTCVLEVHNFDLHKNFFLSSLCILSLTPLFIHYAADTDFKYADIATE